LRYARKIGDFLFGGTLEKEKRKRIYIKVVDFTGVLQVLYISLDRRLTVAGLTSVGIGLKNNAKVQKKSHICKRK